MLFVSKTGRKVEPALDSSHGDHFADTSAKKKKISTPANMFFQEMCVETKCEFTAKN